MMYACIMLNTCLLVKCITGYVEDQHGIGWYLETAPIIWSNLICVGNEESITNCSYTELDENHNCVQNDDIIIIACCNNCHCKFVNMCISLKEYIIL